MKTITTEMESHLEQEVTSLATCWRITRQDGPEFFFTDHDVALTVDGNLYKADSGYKRTAVANDSSLSVDNLDIEGVFDDEEITETDLRAGLFDFARIQIFVVNWDDLSQGIIRMRSGRMGEVNLTEQGVFRSELRGLTQQLSQRIGEVYTPECRADLGDERCKIPIDPPLREDSTAYELGDNIRVPTNSQAVPSTTKFLTHLNTDAKDEATTNVGTLGTSTQIQSTETKFGGGALEVSPGVGPDDNAKVTWPSDSSYNMSGQSFAVEGWVRFRTTGSNFAYMISRGSSGTTSGWSLQLLSASSQIRFLATTNVGTIILADPDAINLDQWYHIAATRDTGTDTYRLFVDGAEKASTVNSDTFQDASGDDIWMGSYNFTVFRRSMDGYLDEWRITVGSAVYTSNFTPPTEEFPGGNIPDDQRAYENRYYTCEVAGTSAASQPAYDTTIGNTTVDGTAEFLTENAWMRDGEVDTVTDRKTFTLTAGFDEARAVDDWFNGGALQFETGDNDGRSIEIRDWTQSTREVTLFLPASFTIEPGTQVRLYPGCDKRLSTCRDKFDNVLNFRGEPHVPGQDQFTRYPDAKSA